MRAFERRTPELVVLDVGMPEMDGLEVCRLMRRTSDVPILFLSARDEEIDRILGLEMGGDDYVTKPFSPRELVARVNVILRRVRAAPAGDALRRCSRMAGCRWIRPAARPASANGSSALTAIEFAILKSLIAQPAHVLSRSQLMDASHAANIHISDRTVDSHIRNIRAKLADGRLRRRDRDRARRRLQARQVRRVNGERERAQMAAAHRLRRAGHPADGDGAAAGRAVLLPHLREPADAPDRGRADRPGCGDRRDLCAGGARGRAAAGKARRSGGDRARSQRQQRRR